MNMTRPPLPKFVAFGAAALVIAAACGQNVAASTHAAPVVCSNRAAAPKLAGKPVSLTGIYSDSRQFGRFYVRQVGTCVYLMGQSNADANGPAGKGFTTIFTGGIAANLTLKGIWSDVPYGDVTGAGTILWKISEPSGVATLTVLQSSGGWGANQLIQTT